MPNQTINAYQLGAALYVPATHPQLREIIQGTKLSNVRTLIYCTEDAIREDEVEFVLKQLESVIAEISAQDSRHHFIRLRNPKVMQRVLAFKTLEPLCGFVLPKISAHNLNEYAPLTRLPHKIMPTLESAEVFLESEMVALRSLLCQPEWFERILCLRIGGNDLLNLLNMRRPDNVTIYQTPIATVIARLVGIFKPYGFYLSAPAFEFLNQTTLLEQEVAQDLLYGLTGKTAIHPSQIPIIEALYQISDEDVELAQQILTSDKAVFKAHEAMQEVSTHHRWAREILKQR